ncbi:MAG TPA: YggS family pyridoxal phosphate-dependent enzyme [Bryobacteraceae bacterium]
MIELLRRDSADFGRFAVSNSYDGILPLDSSSFAARLDAVENRLQQVVARTGRKRSDITLVAVAKKFSAERIREAYYAGLRDFGENYVQEFAAKKPFLTDLQQARFHLIGHLQSNKARLACDLFDVIETADSSKALEKLDRSLQENGRQMNILFEIKLSAEQSKTGASPNEIPQLLASAARCSQLNVTGLMTIPPWSEDAEASRPYFRQLAALARQYGLPQLSMGMSNDFEVAIEEGATIIRVGTALFGPRPKPQTTSPA